MPPVLVALLNVAAMLFLYIFRSFDDNRLARSRYIVQAKYIELHGPGYFFKEWGQTVPAWTDMPLVPLVYGIVFHVFGETKLGIQVFTSLLFSGTVVLTYLIGRTLWNQNIGLSAGALLLGIPYLFTQVPLFMVDIATMFFLALAVFAIIKAVDNGYTAQCILASAAITLALLTKYSN